MRGFVFLVGLFASLIWESFVCNAQVVINEIMQSNVDYLLVEKDFPDSWIELYNKSDNQINLIGYYIGEKREYKSNYKIPNDCYLVPNGHLVIYCDKENKELHTDFRLDSGKGDLYLFNADGELLDELH